MNSDKRQENRPAAQNDADAEHSPSPRREDESGTELVSALRHLTQRLERVERDLEKARSDHPASPAGPRAVPDAPPRDPTPRNVQPPDFQRPRTPPRHTAAPQAGAEPPDRSFPDRPAEQPARIAPRFGNRPAPTEPAQSIEDGPHVVLGGPPPGSATGRFSFEGRTEGSRIGGGRPQPGMMSSGPMSSGPVPSGPMPSRPAPGGARRSPTVPRPAPRHRRGRLLFWLLLVAAVGAGGFWVFRDQQVDEVGGRITSQLQSMIDPAPTGEEPVEEPAPAPPETDPAGSEAVAPPPSGADADQAPADQPEAPEPQTAEREPAEPEPAPSTPGPSVEASPREEVEIAELETRSPEEMASLPSGAPAEVAELARLALDGNADAQHDLATVFALGQEVPQDYERAAYWYRRSANGGVVNAQYNLGVLTERGLGVAQDSERAFQLFLRAAEAGHPDAQNAVGLAYMSGRGVDEDLTEAATWFQAASGNGNPRGAYHLGRLFEQGLDGAPDLAAAAGWYRIAAESGDQQAEDALQRITATGGAAAEAPPAGASPSVPATTPAPVPPGAEEVPVTAEMIREVQQRLEALDYNPGPADGLMGGRTRDAIRQFQQDRGLPVTGEPSSRLLSTLRTAGNG